MTESWIPKVGDRVLVHPESQRLRHLSGEIGTVESVGRADRIYASGETFWPLLVRLDWNGETIGVGSHGTSGAHS